MGTKCIKIILTSWKGRQSLIADYDMIKFDTLALKGKIPLNITLSGGASGIIYKLLKNFTRTLERKK
jgi:hypothetical protein